MGVTYRLMFATDLHGSEVSFDKLVKQARKTSPDLLILGGDLFGNVIIAVERRGRDYFLDGEKVDLEGVQGKSKESGFYLFVGTKDEVEELKSNKSLYHKELLRMAEERVFRWTDHISKELDNRKVKVLWNLAHTDPLELDRALNSAGVEVMEERIVEFRGMNIASLGLASGTEDGFRVAPDSNLYMKGKELLERCERGRTLINFHMPPLNTRLDESKVGGKRTHVGSKAVVDLIREFSPFLGLHGHVHDSFGQQRLGETLVVNPGSAHHVEALNYALINVSLEISGRGAAALSRFVAKDAKLFTDYWSETA